MPIPFPRISQPIILHIRDVLCKSILSYTFGHETLVNVLTSFLSIIVQVICLHLAIFYNILSTSCYDDDIADTIVLGPGMYLLVLTYFIASSTPISNTFNQFKLFLGIHTDYLNTGFSLQECAGLISVHN